MAREEQVLVLLEQGRVDAVHTEAARQERYKGEDAERVRVRAEEDRAYAQGNVDRQTIEAQMREAIAARGLTPEAQVASLSARVTRLAELVEPAKTEPPKADAADPKAAPAG